jgi:hypothetical protein
MVVCDRNTDDGEREFATGAAVTVVSMDDSPAPVMLTMLVPYVFLMLTGFGAVILPLTSTVRPRQLK